MKQLVTISTKLKNIVQLIKKVTLIKAIIGIAVIAIVVPFTIYKNVFNGGYSSYSSDWGNFGGYYGGVVGPLLSLISVILILITIKNQNLDSKIQFKNMQLQRFEQSFNENLVQRYSIVSSFNDNNSDGFQVLKNDVYHIIEDFRIRHNSVIDTILIREKVLILKYVGLFNYIIVLGKSIEISVNEESEKEKYYALLRYSLTESEMMLLLVFKYNKILSENYLDIIDKILGIYKDITIENLASSVSHSLYEAALMQEKINIVL